MNSIDTMIGDLLRETAIRVCAEYINAAVLRAAENGVWPAAAWTAMNAATKLNGTA